MRLDSWSNIARRIRVPLGFAFAIVYFLLARPSAWSIVAGSIIAAAGLLVRGVASGHVQKNEELATSGPYAYVRNPLYVGSVFLAAGFAVASRNWWVAAAAVLIFVVIYVPVICSEEAFLRGKFPEFPEYANNVPRFVPRLTAFGKKGAFSWRLYLQHREYNAILGTVVTIALLVAKLLWLT